MKNINFQEDNIVFVTQEEVLNKEIEILESRIDNLNKELSNTEVWCYIFCGYFILSTYYLFFSGKMVSLFLCLYISLGIYLLIIKLNLKWDEFLWSGFNRLYKTNKKGLLIMLIFPALLFSYYYMTEDIFKPLQISHFPDSDGRYCDSYYGCE